MTFIFRWLTILVLLILVAASLAPAAAVTVAQLGLGYDLSQISEALQQGARNSSWTEAALWYGAAIFFLIAAIRLVRKTQAFWMWLLGFACYGARWAITQQAQEGGVLGVLQGFSLSNLSDVSAEAPTLQLGLLAFHLLIGVVILFIDQADHEYWDRHGA